VLTWDPRGIACAMMLHAIGDSDLARLLEVGQAAELLDGSSQNGTDALRRTTLVLRRLAADGVPIHDPDIVRDTVLERQPGEGTRDLAERARHRLIREALAGLAQEQGGPLPVVSFSKATESRLARQARAQRRGDAVVIALDAPTRAVLQTALEGIDPPSTGILVVSSPELRAALSPLLRTARLPFRAVDRGELEHVQWTDVAVVELPEEATPDA
jgi:flagellar biosynthesis component FlhA